MGCMCFYVIADIPQTALANGVLTMFDLKGVDRPGPEIAWLSVAFRGFQNSSRFFPETIDIFQETMHIF